MNISDLGLEYIRVDTGNGKYKTKTVKPSDKVVYRFVKRLFDVTAGVFALIILFVPLVIVGILIKLDSPGEAIFKQERLGKDGRSFVMYKFRTMCENAEKDGARWAEVDDDRCTRLGRYLRKARADEWPQLINIIKGEMSIVGPRPERECFYNEFEKYIEGFRQRLAVKPGLTGWAQVSGGYDLKPEEKIIWDLDYIENCGMIFDIKIILKTVAIIFNYKGAR